MSAAKKADERASAISAHVHGQHVRLSANLAPEEAPTRTSRYKFRPKGSTWGDFGPDDQRGRLNLVTPEKVKQGIDEVKDYRTFCLSLPLNLPGPMFVMGRGPPVLAPTGDPAKPTFNQPMSAKYTDFVCDDRVDLTLQYSSQWDSLAHVGGLFDLDGEGKPVVCYYNGYKAGEHIVGPATYAPDFSGTVLSHDGAHVGARALGVQNLAEHPVQGRAVMIDLERHYGRGKRTVGWKEVKAVMDKDGVVVKKGDFVLFHTGFGRMLMEANGKVTKEMWNGTGCALDGRDQHLLDWITESGAVALIADNVAVESMSNPPKDRSIPCAALGIHEHCLFKLGVYLGELWYLSELADYLAKVGRTAFLLTAPPLRLPGAVGSPAQGIATV
ncbi:hypothetical protein DFJ74DRAFT_259211 [Hyaloraphidium curvatum]|nr:hypothetical protein DFJ74DRAFT_259211 [Hyaloraphidium curvatum]